MAAALGVMGAAIINKASSPNVAWNKSKRSSGGLFDDVEEVVPLWHTAKKNSTAIFSSDSGIQDAKKIITDDLGTFVIKTAEEQPEEEEEEQLQPPQEEQLAEPVVDTSAVEAEQPAVVQPAFDVIDESVEAINAAVDAAIQTANNISPADPSEGVVAEAPPAEQPPAAPSPTEHSHPAQS